MSIINLSISKYFFFNAVESHFKKFKDKYVMTKISRHKQVIVLNASESWLRNNIQELNKSRYHEDSKQAEIIEMAVYHIANNVLVNVLKYYANSEEHEEAYDDYQASRHYDILIDKIMSKSERKISLNQEDKEAFSLEVQFTYPYNMEMMVKKDVLDWHNSNKSPMELSDDPCNVLKIFEYKPPKLTEAKGVDKYRGGLLYFFIENEKEWEKNGKGFAISYDANERTATVENIKCAPFNSKCKEFWKDGYDHDIHGTWTPEKLEIKMVFLGEAKNSGHCSKAVAYMLKVLLIEAQKENEYPSKGKVYISSRNACAAVNCYSHAYMMNGFLPDPKEFNDFMEQSKKRFGLKMMFTFYNFVSKDQERLKYINDKQKQEKEKKTKSFLGKRRRYQALKF